MHVYSTLIGGLLAGAATAVCRDKGRKRCINDKLCGWQKLKTGNGTEKNCVAVKPEANPGTCETETAQIAKQKAKIGKQKKQINKLKAKIAKLQNGSGSGSGSGQDSSLLAPLPTAEPEFVVHEGIGWCSSDLDENDSVMWKGSISVMGVDKTADDCWKECQAEFPQNQEPLHQFYNDGVDTWCICKDGCECMNDVGIDNTLAPPDFSPPTCCQDDNMVSSSITCSGGSYPDEVGWSLACDDGTTLRADAPYGAPWESELAVVLGATCTLEMTDLYADGWEGGEWAAPGFGQTFTMDGSEGQTKTVSFVVQ